MTDTSTSKALTNWKLVEKVVRLLESALAPDAEVKHNQKLHDHSSGGGRQCDTIVFMGAAPRQTITIVEVQDRADPLGIQDLEGFYQKMQSVHAQHLICVTIAGFTEQALGFARNKGPSIRLVKLAELEKSNWPINLAFGRMGLLEQDPKPVGCHVKGSRFDDFALEKSPGAAQIDLQAKVFKFQKHGEPGRVITASDVFRSAVDEMQFYRHLEKPIRVKMARRFDQKDRLWVKLGKRTFCVGHIELEVEMRTHLKYFPLTMHSYEQVDYQGALAWAAVAKAELNGKPVHVRQVFVPNKDGTWNHIAEIEGVRRAGFFMEPLDEAGMAELSRFIAKQDGVAPTPLFKAPQ